MCSLLQFFWASQMTKKFPTECDSEKSPYNTSGVQENIEICLSDDFGRILRSRLDLEQGYVIFVETPILLSLCNISTEEESILLETSESTGLNVIDDFIFLKAYCSASSETRKLVEDCFAPGRLAIESSELLRSLLKVVDSCKRFQWSQGFSCDELERVVLIKACNAHGCYSQSSSSAALYTYGSKMRHSCCPNVTYTSQREPGKGCFIAACDIRAGDELFITYIDIYKSARIRSQELSENYLFQCDCEMCTVKVDRFRGIYCGGACEGTLFRDQSNGVWTCDECDRNCTDETKPISNAGEDALYREVLSFINSFNVNIPAPIRTLRARLMEELGQKHCLTKIVEKAYIEHHLLRNMNSVVESSDELERITDDILVWCGNDPSFLDSTLVRIACGIAVCGKFDKAMRYFQIVLEDMHTLFGVASGNENLEIVRRGIAACTARKEALVPDVIITNV